MTVTTKRDLIAQVAAQWHAQYYRNGEWKPVLDDASERIYEQLRHLPESAREADVTAIISNDAWTTIRCTECDRNVGVAVVFAGGDKTTLTLCAQCLRTALFRLEDSEYGDPTGHPTNSMTERKDAQHD